MRCRSGAFTVAVLVLCAGAACASGFLDLSDAEWKALWQRPAPASLTSYQPVARTLTREQIAAASSGSFSWTGRSPALVTRVKNQAACGSCTVFSILAAIEIQRARTNGSLLSLSEQSVLDCVHGAGMLGCTGANVLDVADALRREGIAPEFEYEYRSFVNRSNFPCRNVTRSVYVNAVERPSGPSDVSYEDVMAAYVRLYGPLQTSLDASLPSFRTYSGGVLQSGPTGAHAPLTHGVVIVGFGSDDGVPYWLIKNSWGPQWGEHGYLRLQRGRNLLGVADQVFGIQTR